MGVNHVNLANGELLIDLRNDTVSASTLVKGATAHDKAGNPITGGFEGIIPTETINIDKNTDSPMDITKGKWLNVNVPIPSGYEKLNKYYYERYNPPGSALVLSRTFTCGFRPKIILIVPYTDVTFSTTNSEIFSAYISIGSHELRREGLYKLSTSNRVGASSGGLGSLTDTGFTYTHATIGFKPGVEYDVYVWGES